MQQLVSYLWAKVQLLLPTKYTSSQPMGRILDCSRRVQANTLLLPTNGDLFTAPALGPLQRYNRDGTLIDQIPLPFNYTGDLVLDESVKGGALYVCSYSSIIKVTNVVSDHMKHTA